MAADSEDLVILACTVLIQSQSRPIYRRTDGQTDRATDTDSKTDASTTAYILSRVKNHALF